MYTRESALTMDPSSYRHFSCMDPLDSDLTFDARLAFSLEKALGVDLESVDDEGYFEGEQEEDVMAICMKSHFSTTTTSTSEYVQVPRVMRDYDCDSIHSATCSTIEARGKSATTRSLRETTRRRLRKRRPALLKASTFTSNTSSTPSSLTPSGKAKSPTDFVHLLPSIPKFKKESSLDGHWVYVDVTQKITQRLV